MEEPVLPERILNLLLASDYARLVGRSTAAQLGYIVDIASLHTREELVRKPGLGRGTVRQIEDWLSFHGRRLRRPNQTIESVICGLEFRKRSRRASRASRERRRS
jgi:hypothetical protein